MPGQDDSDFFPPGGRHRGQPEEPGETTSPIAPGDSQGRSGYYDRLRRPGDAPPPVVGAYPRLAEISGVTRAVHPGERPPPGPRPGPPRPHQPTPNIPVGPPPGPPPANTEPAPTRRTISADPATEPRVNRPDTQATDRPGRRAAPGGEGHGHGHGHSPAAPVSRRVRTLIAALLIPLALLTAAGVLWLYPFTFTKPQSVFGAQQNVRGEVVAATGARNCPGDTTAPGTAPPSQNAPQCDQLSVRLTSGEATGTTITQTVPIEPSTPTFTQGDQVVLAYSGAEPRSELSYRIVDFQRDKPILLLAAIFALAVLVLGRWRGLAALAALGLSFVVLGLFVFPALLAGQNPLLVAIAGGGLIMFLVLYLTHGFSARTSTAVLGTLTSLILIGVLSYAFALAARLTGLNDDTANLIGSLGHGVDSRGLLLAGIIIGSLGVLDDVTVTQSSAVWELRLANPDYTVRQLYTSAVRIGRDHVGSAVNTLAMAYAGAALPLLLLFTLSNQGLGQILTSQLVAEELVRTLVGSIGLIASVPVTTVLAALVASREPVPG